MRIARRRISRSVHRCLHSRSPLPLLNHIYKRKIHTYRRTLKKLWNSPLNSLLTLSTLVMKPGWFQLLHDWSRVQRFSKDHPTSTGPIWRLQTRAIYFFNPFAYKSELRFSPEKTVRIGFRLQKGSSKWCRFCRTKETFLIKTGLRQVKFYSFFFALFIEKHRFSTAPRIRSCHVYETKSFTCTNSLTWAARSTLINVIFAYGEQKRWKAIKF